MLKIKNPDLFNRYLGEIKPQIQVTLNCNLNCDYCFQEHVGPVMTRETSHAIMGQIADTFYPRNETQPERRDLHIYWHGGEPLIAGLGFFEDVVQFQKNYPHINFINHLQTNGILLTDKFAKFFVENKFQLGFSIDGPAHIHDIHRISRGGKPTFKSVMRGIETYRKYSTDCRTPVIWVVTRKNIEHVDEVYDFFRTIRASVGIDIYDVRAHDLGPNAWNKNWAEELAPSSEQIGNFLVRLFDLWFYDKNRDVEIRELRDEVKIVLHPDVPIGNPIDKKRCHITRTIFDSFGNVFSCDQYVNDQKSSLGNVHTESLRDIVMRKARLWESIKKHIRRSNEQFACTKCEWASRCSGGCMTCMKYNSLLLHTRAADKPDHEWTDLVDNTPTPLDSLYGEFYYCGDLVRFRDHVRRAIEKEMGGPASSEKANRRATQPSRVTST